MGLPAPNQSTLTRIVKTYAASVFVWGVWAAMTLGALAFTWRLGSAVVPHGDEWRYMAYVSGAETVTPAFLWRQHVEHRIVTGD